MDILHYFFSFIQNFSHYILETKIVMKQAKNQYKPNSIIMENFYTKFLYK